MNTNTTIKMPPVTTVDITPTWGEWGRIYRRYAESGERLAIKQLAKDFARAMSACEALKAINSSLTPEQRAQVDLTIKVELAKQGFDS